MSVRLLIGQIPENSKPRVIGRRKATGPNPERLAVSVVELSRGMDSRVAEGEEMKNKLPLVILILATLVWGAGGKSVTRNESLLCNSFLPEIGYSFNSLDARDRYNNPLNSPKVKQDLVNIFYFSLYNLVIESEVHSVAKSLYLLRKSLKLSETYFSMLIPQVGTFFINAVNSLSKRFERLLVRLSGIFALVIAITYLSQTYFKFALTQRRIAPTILLC